MVVSLLFNAVILALHATRHGKITLLLHFATKHTFGVFIRREQEHGKSQRQNGDMLNLFVLSSKITPFMQAPEIGQVWARNPPVPSFSRRRIRVRLSPGEEHELALVFLGDEVKLMAVGMFFLLKCADENELFFDHY